MAEVVTMPRLSDTMTDGTVAQWHKKVGDQVQEGDLLAEIETDKATMEFESFQEGTLLYIGVEEGDSAPVDSILAILGEKGEDFEALIKDGAKSVQSNDEDSSISSTESTDSSQAKESTPSVMKESSQDESGRIKASPLAKKMAEEKGYDIRLINGTGDGGRIVKRDIEDFTPSSQSSQTASVNYSGQESFDDLPVSQMRKTIARRLAESKFTSPHFYLTIDVDMDQAFDQRELLKQNGIKVSYNDLVVKAASLALKKHPKVNSSWRGDYIRQNHHVHMGVAVAVDDGLLVPVVRHSDQKGLQQISQEVREFAERARDKKLQPSDWEGNTFTISNLGMFGIEEFTAIINPPDACILAVGGIREEAVVKQGAVVPGKRMKLTLSCDHRVVDGATGAAFLQELKANLELPVRMLV
jgi:pyruvate dehydrogenase E2 component (dihydrolipoamide acetyltransferase)